MHATHERIYILYVAVKSRQESLLGTFAQCREIQISLAILCMCMLSFTLSDGIYLKTSFYTFTCHRNQIFTAFFRQEQINLKGVQCFKPLCEPWTDFLRYRNDTQADIDVGPLLQHRSRAFNNMLTEEVSPVKPLFYVQKALVSVASPIPLAIVFPN